jgi:hypothetical protein
LCQYWNSDKSETFHNQPSKRGHHHSNPAHRHLHPQKSLVLCCQDDLCNYGAQQVELRFNSILLKGRNESQGKWTEAHFPGLQFSRPRYRTRTQIEGKLFDLSLSNLSCGTLKKPIRVIQSVCPSAIDPHRSDHCDEETDNDQGRQFIPANSTRKADGKVCTFRGNRTERAG